VHLKHDFPLLKLGELGVLASWRLGGSKTLHSELNPNSEVAGGFVGILTTDPTSPRLPPSLKLRRTRRRTGGTDFHGFKDTPNRFENVSITLTSSVPIRAIRGSILVFDFNHHFRDDRLTQVAELLARSAEYL
jgi:hypothetical protein